MLHFSNSLFVCSVLLLLICTHIDKLFDGAKEKMRVDGNYPKNQQHRYQDITKCSPVSMILSSKWLEIMFNLDVMTNFGEK